MTTPGTDSAAPAGMRVALDVTPLIGPLTGIGRLVAGLVDALEHRRPPDVTVQRFAVTARGRRRAGALHPPVPARLAHRLWARAAFPPVEWLTGRVDVVHGTNYVVPPARRAARVVSVHDLAALEHPDWVAEPSRRFPGMIERAVGEGAWVHCDSEHVAAKVRAWLGTDRVRAVHPGIPPGPARLRPRSEREPRRTVLFVGTVEPRKDVPGLVRAFADIALRPGLADTELVLAGGRGWGSAAADLEVAVAALPTAVAARVRILGWVDDAERRRLLADASVMAYPSRDEGFGFPPLEAMAAGVPVVSSDAGSLPEILGPAAEIVPSGDRGALAEALARVLTDHQRADELVELGVARAASYSWDAMADGMVGLYREGVAACA